MFKISAFAKMSGISIKTLRYYDELGILKPSAVDESSGYRYYSADHLLTVERIRAYKELGLTLEQIAPLLEKATPDTAAGTLVTKRADLERAIQEAQHQLEEIDRRVQRLEQVGAPAGNGPEAVTLQTLQAQWAASVRDTIPRQGLCLLVNEVREYVKANDFGKAAAGPLIVLWYDAGRSGEGEVIDVEVAFPLEEPTPERGRIRVSELPGHEVAASLIHDCNPYAAHCPAAAQVMEWAASQGYEPVPGEPIREIYIAAEQDMIGKVRRSEVFLPLRNIRSR